MNVLGKFCSVRDHNFRGKKREEEREREKKEIRKRTGNYWLNCETVSINVILIRQV